MDLKKMTVSEGCLVQDPYKFKAETGGKTVSVMLVMPLGGVESGLYRSPKAGENVLVASVDGSAGVEYYLMGYLPDSNTQNFNPAQENTDGKLVEDDAAEVINDAGEVFRYGKTGKNISDRPYSEIGFYNKATLWAATSHKDKNGNDVADPPPKIDRINIQSTGDIYTDADNHHRMTGRRLELLATQSKIDEDAVNEDTKELNCGDISINADRNIVIEAGRTILLKVGRTVVTISDAGFNVTSQIIESDIPSPFDACLNVNFMDGISLFGKTVCMDAGYKWYISNGLGASVAGTAGNLVLSGNQIDMSTMAIGEREMGYMSYALDFVTSGIISGLALRAHTLSDKTDISDCRKIAYALLISVVSLKNLIDIGYKGYKGYKDIEKVRYLHSLNNAFPNAFQSALNADDLMYLAVNSKPYTIYSLLLDIMLETIKTVHRIVEYCCTEDSTMTTSLSLEAGLDDHKSTQDAINFSFLIVENAIIELFCITDMSSNISESSSSISLECGGEINMVGDKLTECYANESRALATPVPLRFKWIANVALCASVSAMFSQVTKVVLDAKTIYKAEYEEDPLPELRN